MPKSPIYRASVSSEALRQGEILTGVIQFKPIPDRSSPSFDNIQFAQIIHPYGIIVSQDCDLDWDYKARQEESKPQKLLNTILFCEVYAAPEIRRHPDMNSQQWNSVKTNRHEQYHFFEQVPSECDLSQEGLPELTADLKKVFSIDAQFLYHQISIKKAQRRTVLVSPYLEHFSNRYHSFQGRVALPAPHESEKGG